MVFNIESIINEFNFEEKFNTFYTTYDKYINFRFDHVIRTSLSQFPSELHRNIDYSLFDPNQKFISTCVAGHNNNYIEKLRNELKNLTTEVNVKKKEISILSINEDGLRKNIKHLEEIIVIKENFIRETTNYTEIRCNAREKVQKEYLKVHKKYCKLKCELEKSRESAYSSNCSAKQAECLERLTEKVSRYEAKIKKMADIIKIATDSKEKLLQYKLALRTSRERLLMFKDQLHNQLKLKRELTSLLSENEAKLHLLKANLSNLGVVSSIEKSRINTPSNLIEDYDLKKGFVELQSMRDEVLSFRPKGMFNPKYQRENNLTKGEIRKYLENDEAIDSIDYLIELKNNDVCNNDLNLLKYMQMNSKESSIFLKCLSSLSVIEIKKLLIHYFNRVVDLKEAGRENDEIISKLDEINDRQRHNIVNLNNSYQEFHLSIEKKFISLKKYYQEKINMFLEHLQEESNAITVFKMRQEISTLKKKIAELEKSHISRRKESYVTPEPHFSSDHLDISKSGSETVSSAKVTLHKNKLKIQKTKSKLV